MMVDILQVLGSVIGLAVNVIVQILLFKCDPRHRLLRSVFFGFMAGIAALFAVECRIFSGSSRSLQDLAALFIADLMTYGLLGYCYFHFINLGETARRIRLLRELYDAPAGLTKDQLLSRYNAKEIISVRLNRLLNNNQVLSRDARFYIASPVMLFISKTLVLMRTSVLGKRK